MAQREPAADNSDVRTKWRQYLLSHTVRAVDPATVPAVMLPPGDREGRPAGATVINILLMLPPDLQHSEKRAGTDNIHKPLSLLV